jgi:DNA-3-methyladenine glycosylase II
LSQRRPARARAATPRILASEADVAAGIRALRRKCAIMRHMHDLAGSPPVRRRPAGLEGLARIIVAQQLSVASAAAIWTRTAQAVTPFDAPTLAAVSDDALRAAGLSRPKIRTLRAIAGAALDGLDFERLDTNDDAGVHAALTAISGVGPWTADIFIMFCLGRADAFAAGDLALQVAAQMAMGLDARPSAAELLEISERWRPWRTVAALQLWAYYKAVKEARSGVPV